MGGKQAKHVLVCACVRAHAHTQAGGAGAGRKVMRQAKAHAQAGGVCSTAGFLAVHDLCLTKACCE